MILDRNEIAELIHIYHNQPVKDGDTLSGTTKRSLRSTGLIQTVDGQNITTPLGNKVVKKYL